MDRRKDFTTRESVKEINKEIEHTTGMTGVRVEGKFKFIPKGMAPGLGRDSKAGRDKNGTAK